MARLILSLAPLLFSGLVLLYILPHQKVIVHAVEPKILVTFAGKNSPSGKNMYDYSDEFIPAPFYPWNNDIERANEDILSQLRAKMVLEIKDEILPDVLRAQKDLQKQVAEAKALREQSSSSRTKASEILADRVKYANLVNTMVNESILMRNVLGDVFQVHVVYDSASSATHKDNLARTKEFAPHKLTHVARAVAEDLRKQELRLHEDEHDGNTIPASTFASVSANGETEGIAANMKSTAEELDINPDTIVDNENYSEPDIKPLDMSRIHGYLSGLCLTLPTGYWTYEWCYANSLKQYHAEPTQPVPATSAGQDIPYVQTNINALGYFRGSQAINDDESNRFTHVERLIEHYDGGPTCSAGEQHVPRQATVTVQCCSIPMEEEMKRAPPTGMNQQMWYQIQAIIRSHNAPENPMVIHNPHDSTVQPIAISPEFEAHKPGHEHLANFNGAHHPPHHSPHHQRSFLDRQSDLMNSEQKGTYGERYDHWGHFAAIAETSLCQYQVVACIPLLCPPEHQPFTDASAATGAQARGVGTVTTSKKSSRKQRKQQQEAREDKRKKVLDLEDVVQELTEQCMLHIDDWWQYEVCFKSGIRQFHMHQEMQKDATGKISTRFFVQGEFSLGLAPTAVYQSREALQAALVGDSALQSQQAISAGLPNALLEKAYRPRALVFTFEGGSPCDIENVKRSSMVEVTCSPSGRDAIASVVEDRTCHYFIAIHSAKLCQLEEFRRPMQKTSLLEFVRQDEAEVHRFFLQERLGVEAAVAHAERIRQQDLSHGSGKKQGTHISDVMDSLQEKRNTQADGGILHLQ